MIGSAFLSIQWPRGADIDSASAAVIAAGTLALLALCAYGLWLALRAAWELVRLALEDARRPAHIGADNPPRDLQDASEARAVDDIEARRPSE